MKRKMGSLEYAEAINHGVFCLLKALKLERELCYTKCQRDNVPYSKRVSAMHGDEHGIIVDGNRFIFLGNGASRWVYRGPDGVVYKVSISPTRTQADPERQLFNLLDEYQVPWCPDYWPYPNGVMAMKEYSTLHAQIDLYSPRYERTFKEMLRSCSDVYRSNIGVDENGDLVLLDGGCFNTTTHHPYIAQRYAHLLAAAT
jgi:hypothetical protein